MTKFADLHVHTHYSDSTLTPSQVVEESVLAGIACVGITDHDTLDGVEPTSQAAALVNLEIISGVELSSEINNQDIHILGYFVDYKDKNFCDKLNDMQDVRVVRVQKMIDKLKEAGIDNIDAKEVCALAESKSVGRPHLAIVLKEKGWVSSVQEAFSRYLAEGALAYVKKYKQTPYEAIELIRSSGGVAVLAHPMVTNRDELIPSFVQAGLQGLEVYYPNCSQPAIEYYEKLGKKYNLVLTGGSDAHGDSKNNTFVGKAKVPYDVVEDLRRLAGK